MNLHSFNPKNYTRRNSNSLLLYKYSSYRAYSVIICSYKRQRALEIPRIHQTVLEKWLYLPRCFPGVLLDAFKIMPDNMQGILWFDKNMKHAPTLDQMIRVWKGRVEIEYQKYHRNTQTLCLNHLWQRGYYEHMIRDEEDLELAREYIMNNPLEAFLMKEQRYVFLK